mmetsp:Transcript_23949/g.95035  ORF Transcript_23949/g.95035 Transcript_23949/m.95035 type:complete len:338 (-) Transcript_23949:166-1179(-)
MIHVVLVGVVHARRTRGPYSRRWRRGDAKVRRSDVGLERRSQEQRPGGHSRDDVRRPAREPVAIQKEAVVQKDRVRQRAQVRAQCDDGPSRPRPRDHHRRCAPDTGVSTSSRRRGGHHIGGSVGCCRECCCLTRWWRWPQVFFPGEAHGQRQPRDPLVFEEDDEARRRDATRRGRRDGQRDARRQREASPCSGTSRDAAHALVIARSRQETSSRVVPQHEIEDPHQRQTPHREAGKSRPAHELVPERVPDERQPDGEAMEARVAERGQREVGDEVELREDRHEVVEAERVAKNESRDIRREARQRGVVAEIALKRRELLVEHARARKRRRVAHVREL